MSLVDVREKITIAFVLMATFWVIEVAKAADAKPLRFIYQLQHVDVEFLHDVDADLIIIDWEYAKLTRGQLRGLQEQGKKVVTYLSIGEAEDYRDYWKQEWGDNPPSFLEEENPVWKGNYKVRFWEPEWQEVIFAKLSDIVAHGYDGVYLDIIDAYYYFSEKGIEHARENMVQFVKDISAYTKSGNSSFLVIPQNSPELVIDEGYMDAIDGIANENTWYDDDAFRSAEDIDWETKHLDMVVVAEKMVLAVEYTTEADKICDFFSRAKARHYAAFVGSRALDGIGQMECSDGE